MSADVKRAPVQTLADDVRECAEHMAGAASDLRAAEQAVLECKNRLHSARHRHSQAVTAMVARISQAEG